MSAVRAVYIADWRALIAAEASLTEARRAYRAECRKGGTLSVETGRRMADAQRAYDRADAVFKAARAALHTAKAA